MQNVNNAADWPSVSTVTCPCSRSEVGLLTHSVFGSQEDVDQLIFNEIVVCEGPASAVKFRRVGGPGRSVRYEAETTDRRVSLPPIGRSIAPCPPHPSFLYELEPR